MLIIPLTIAISLLAVSAMASSLLVEPFRCIMYLTGYDIFITILASIYLAG